MTTGGTSTHSTPKVQADDLGLRSISLASEALGGVPAVVLAEMLGIAIGTAVNWVHAARGDQANYAALTVADADHA